MARPHEILPLRDEERMTLTQMSTKGIHASREIKRAEILLKGDQGYTVQEIAEMVGRSVTTVYNVRRRYIVEGLESALYDKPRPGAPPKFSKKDEALITTIACSEVPPGYSSWTLLMIADRFVELSESGSICAESVRQRLKKLT